MQKGTVLPPYLHSEWLTCCKKVMSWQVPHLSGFGKLRSLRYTMSLSHSLGRYTLPVFVESTMHICRSIKASQISFHLCKPEIKQVTNSTAEQNSCIILLEVKKKVAKGNSLSSKHWKNLKTPVLSLKHYFCNSMSTWVGEQIDKKKNFPLKNSPISSKEQIINQLFIFTSNN